MKRKINTFLLGLLVAFVLLSVAVAVKIGVNDAVKTASLFPIGGIVCSV